MNQELAQQISKRLAKAIASQIAGSKLLATSWNGLSGTRRQEYIDTWTVMALDLLKNSVPELDEDLPILIKEIGRRDGFGRLMRAVNAIWVLEAKDESMVNSIGPCLGALTPCGCDDPESCVWCYGTGTLTHHVKACKDGDFKVGGANEEPEPLSSSPVDKETDWTFNALNMVQMIGSIRNQGLANFECAVNGPGILKGQERIIDGTNMAGITKAMRELGVARFECPTSGPGTLKVEFVDFISVADEEDEEIPPPSEELL